MPSDEKTLEGLLEIFKNQSKKKLADFTTKDNVSFSKFKGLSLQEYVKGRSTFCLNNHSNPYCRCKGFVNVANKIAEFGHVKLKDAFYCVTQHIQPCDACFKETDQKGEPSLIPDQDIFPSYKPSHAKRMLLQMPIAALTIDGLSTSLCDATANIVMLKCLLEKSKQQSSTNSLSKGYFKELISMCNSDKERDCLKYAVGKASGASAKTMRRMYGVENYNRKAREVEDAVEHVQQIRQGIEHLANIKEQAVLMSLGLQSPEESDSDKSEGSEQDTDDEFSDENIKTDVQAPPIPIQPNILRDLLVKSNFNWFAMSEIAQEEIAGVDNANIKDVMCRL